MAIKHKPCILAIGSGATLERVRAAIGDATVIDIRRLRRDYGAAVAGEVLREFLTGRFTAEPRAAGAAPRRSYRSPRRALLRRSRRQYRLRP